METLQFPQVSFLYNNECQFVIRLIVRHTCQLSRCSNCFACLRLLRYVLFMKDLDLRNVSISEILISITLIGGDCHRRQSFENHVNITRGHWRFDWKEWNQSKQYISTPFWSFCVCEYVQIFVIWYRQCMIHLYT